MPDLRPVVVGVDDKPGTDLALEWAVTDAASRNIPLRVVTAFQWVLQYRWSAVYADVRDPDAAQMRHAADQLVARTVARARQLASNLTVDGEAVEGAPVGVLLDESQRAVEVVLGSRHLKTLGSAVLGSVGGGVAARGECPVVIVRGPAGNPAEDAGVVVGVDGRDSGESQLAYAFEQANRYHVPLRAVLFWRPDPLASMQWRSEAPPPERAELWLAEAIAGWEEKYPDVAVHQAVLREHPVAGLVDSSAGAHLLVVGTRSHHALSGTLLGSVSQGVLHHATCPVAVIPTHHG